MQNVNTLGLDPTVTPKTEYQLQFGHAVVINPPNPPGYVSNKDSMGGFGQLFAPGATYVPPLDLVYLASELADKKIPLTVYECLGLELDTKQLIGKLNNETVHAAEDGKPILVIVRTSAPTLDWDLSVCRDIQASNPNTHIALYGSAVPHVLWRIQQESSIQYIIRGEPEESVDALLRGDPDEQIAGLVFRRNGEWIQNPDRLAMRDLDRLPFPKWELFPYKKYQLPRSSARAPVPFLPMLTSRGCPVGCHYCPYPVGQGLIWRWRSPKNVVDEIEHLVRDLGVQYIIFRDPMFSLNQKRVIEICDEIVRRGLELEWRCETRVDFLKEETLRAMAKAGCSGVNFGVESADVAIQANVGRKPIEQKQFFDTIALCRKLGIKTFAFFIVGLPGDTVDSILKTIKFAIDIRTTWIQFTAASPFIGTKLRDWALARGLATEDEYAYVNSHMVLMGNENLSKEQVRVLLAFAQFFERFLVNRKGILKDDKHPSGLYRIGVSIVDSVANGTSRVVYALGKRYLQFRFRPTS